MELAERKDASRMPWVEKYRPKTVDDVSHQEEVVGTLRRALSAGASLPHLLFYGPPGTGKTSTALAMCRQMFASELYNARVMELNASDERGIAVVRNKIKGFAQSAVGKSGPSNGAPNPPFKIIILDEADAITNDAQTALRRTMEAYSKVTRFILICNYISRIIPPLASRCAKFRFQPLPMDAILDRLKLIAAKEEVSISQEVLATLIRSCDGDLRKAITTMQSAHRMVPKKSPVDDRAIAGATCLIPESTIDEFESKIVGSESNYADARQAVQDLSCQGYPANQTLLQFSDRLISEPQTGATGMAGYNDYQRAAVALKLAQAEKCLNDGADEELQLLDFAMTTMSAGVKGTNWRPLANASLTL